MSLAHHKGDTHAYSLILDLQVGLFHGPEQPWRGEALLATVNGLLAKAHAAGADLPAPAMSARPARRAAPDGALTQLIRNWT